MRVLLPTFCQHADVDALPLRLSLAHARRLGRRGQEWTGLQTDCSRSRAPASFVCLL